jgi:hypothetical protein
VEIIFAHQTKEGEKCNLETDKPVANIAAVQFLLQSWRVEMFHYVFIRLLS